MTDFKNSNMDHESNTTQKLSNQHWRLSKEVSIATLIAVGGAMVTGLWQVANLQNEQKLLAADHKALRERVERSENTNDRTIQRIDNTVLRIEQRVNDLLEKK